jgi:hypothetical protein
LPRMILAGRTHFSPFAPHRDQATDGRSFDERIPRMNPDFREMSRCHSLSRGQGGGPYTPAPLAPWNPPPPTPESGRWRAVPQRVSSAALSWSPSSAVPKRLCLNRPAPTNEVNIQSGMAGFTLSERTLSTAICVGVVGGVEGEGGNAFSPFSLHEENMPPKLDYARDPLSPAHHDKWKLVNDNLGCRVADCVPASPFGDKGKMKRRPRNRAV